MYTPSSSTRKTTKEGAETLSELQEAGKQAYNDARDDLRDAANKAGRTLRSMASSAQSEATHAAEIVTTQIRSNPVQSTLLALGAGFLIGALFRRS